MSDDLQDYLPDVGVFSGSTSYFSPDDVTLDPALFDGDTLRPEVRDWILGTLYACWNHHFRYLYNWARVWIAGSGASYQWSAAREPGDLDILIGVDYPQFRRSNNLYAGLTDQEISETLNDTSRAELYPATAAAVVGGKTFEVTWYVNPGATDITSIHPYAAYDVTHNSWTVHPDQAARAPESSDLAARARDDVLHAGDLLATYTAALNSLRRSTFPADRVNAAVALGRAAHEASLMFEEIHSGRRSAFSRYGVGYADPANYRWQAGKASGIVQALQQIHKGVQTWQQAREQKLYGSPLDAADKILRRALAQRASQP